MNKKFFFAAMLAFAGYGIQANAQAIIVTKSNDNKIVLPANKVKDITTTTEELAESLDYFTKDEAAEQHENIVKKTAANEAQIDQLREITKLLETMIQKNAQDIAAGGTTSTGGGVSEEYVDRNVAMLQEKLAMLNERKADKEDIIKLEATVAEKDMEIRILKDKTAKMEQQIEDLQKRSDELEKAIEYVKVMINNFHH